MRAGRVPAAAGLPADWARRPPPGWLLVSGWESARWVDLPRKTRLRLWRITALPSRIVDAN
jgi:hypothetical protein